MKVAITLAGTLMVAVPIFAKQSSDYIPPSFDVRFLHSVVMLSCLALPVIVLLAPIAVALNPKHGAEAWGRAVRWAVLLVLLGAAVAATDALNDEGWNPALYGSVFVAAALPVGIWKAAPREHPYRHSLVAAAAGVALFASWGLAFLGISFCHWAVEHGWPVSW
jgi:hypothetical protein